jgi:SAM-dependent methyltransferase
VPYSEYVRFHEIMKEHSGQVFEETLLTRTVPLVPGLEARLREGIDVLDVGCGSGHAVNLLARAFPASRVVGYDFSAEGIARARAEATEWGLRNARFEVRDVAAMPDVASFDLVTAFDSIHDQAQPRQVLSGISRALRGGGRFLMVDIRASSRLEENLDHPIAPFLYSISTLHCMTVSLALDGEGLGTCWGEQMAHELLAEAGFEKVSVYQVPGDLINNFYVASRG